MSLQQYEIFDEIARQSNFARAAEQLNMSPSAVSHSVAALERELGFPLFFRSRTRVQLTKEGASMLEYVRDILQRERAMRQHAAKIKGLEGGSVTIGTFSSVCLYWIPDIVSSFRQIHPNIIVNILQGDYSDVLGWVRDGTVDIGFETLPTDEKLKETPLHKDRLLCAAPADYVPANGKTVTASDMESMPFIIQRSGYEEDTMKFIRKHRLKINAEHRVDDDGAIIAFVEKGLGISLVPELILNNTSANVKTYPTEPEEKRLIGLITQTKVDLSPAAQAMHEFIVEFIKEQGLYI